MKIRLAAMLAGSSLLALVSPALAQPAPSSPAAAAAEEESDEDEIVVTGTFIRGIAPTGAASVGLNQGDISATNATSSSQVLSSIPQLGSFNDLPIAGITGGLAGVVTNAPSIRGISVGGLTPATSATLTLMDGRRLPAAGIDSAQVDPDVVPPGALARVEVIPDGASALYGADAISGVVNFITRDDFDGFEFNVRQGFGDAFESTDGYFTAGRQWDTGSAYVTFNYTQHDAIYGRDRDWVNAVEYNPASPNVGLPLGRSCNPGSVDVGTTSYDIVNGVPQTTPAAPADVRCDRTDYTSLIYPQERRDSIFAGFSQEMSDSIRFDLRAYYTHRITKSDLGPGLRYPPSGDTSRVITAANNSRFIPITGAPGESQRVFYDFAEIPGYNTTERLDLEIWGFTPEVTIDMGHDWQANAFLNYGHSRTTGFSPNSTELNRVINLNASQINFYDIGAASNTPIWDQVDLTRGQRGYGIDQIAQSRIVFDGPVFELPGGTLRAALGVEYLMEDFEKFQSSTGAAEARRDSTSLFVELNVPVVGPENNVPLVHDLSLSLASRSDSYSDFGEVTVPQYGINYSPLEWITLRGRWGQSFQAPGLILVAAAESATINPSLSQGLGPFLPDDWDQDGAGPAGKFQVDGAHLIVAMAGGIELRPSRADTYQVGFDISPPFIPGLQVGATYWSIDYTDKVGNPPLLNQFFWDDANDAVYGATRVTDFGNTLPVSVVEQFVLANGGSLAELYEDIGNSGLTINDVNILINNATFNLAAQRIAGWDAYVRYTHDTDWGSLFFNFNGATESTNKSNSNGLGFAGNTADDQTRPVFNASLTVGARLLDDDLLLQATTRYTEGYDVAPSASNNQQYEIDSRQPVDLFAQYDGFGEDLTVSLGINNAFDEDPPHYNGVLQTSAGYTGSANLGRVVYLGLNKRF